MTLGITTKAPITELSGLDEAVYLQGSEGKIGFHVGFCILQRP